MVQSAGGVLALLAISDAALAAGTAQGFFSKEFGEFLVALDAADPNPAWVGIVANIWIWSEMLVLLCNKRRRALHDMIAGTIVVITTPSPPPHP
jgi:uncharacterized RDD family membrane protein YckC